MTDSLAHTSKYRLIHDHSHMFLSSMITVSVGQTHYHRLPTLDERLRITVRTLADGNSQNAVDMIFLKGTGYSLDRRLQQRDIRRKCHGSGGHR